MSKGDPRAQRTPSAQIWKFMTRSHVKQDAVLCILLFTMIIIPCGSGAMVTNLPPEKSPMPNYIPIDPEKTEDIELGEINMPRHSKVFLDENSKLETPASGLG